MGFCLFGLVGDCATSTTVNTNTSVTNNKIMEQISEKFLKTMTEMKSSTGNIQEINVRAKGDVMISDVDMTQNINLTTDMQSKLNNVYDVNTLVDTVVDTAAKVSLDDQNKSLITPKTTLTNTEYNVVNSLKTTLKNTIKKEDIISCVSTVINSQVINVQSEGNVVIKTIKMDMTVKAVSKCLLNTVLKYVDQVKIDEKTVTALENETKTKSETPVTDWVFYLLIGIAIIVVFIGLIIGMFVFRGSSNVQRGGKIGKK